jgi:formate transporter
MAGIGVANPGLQRMMFAALFPVNLLLIVATGGQLFTGNSATCAAARYEGLIDNYELIRNWIVSIIGNVIGCAIMAIIANYVGLLTGGTAALCSNTALSKCSYSFTKNFVKAILCNWMVTIAVFLAGASNDLAGKLVGVWFPISTFVAIGLEHSVANMFLLPAALLLKAPISLSDVIFKNIVPVLLGNAIAGAIVVAGSYSYQFGQLGGKRRAIFAEQLAKRELNKRKAEIKKRSNDPARVTVSNQSANGSYL